MADQQNPEVKKAPPTAIELMAEIMLKREMRLVAEDEAKVAALKRREEQRDRNARSEYEDDLVDQAKCKHLKGGKNRIRLQAKDFAVYHHTYINRETVIRCFLCGMKWKPQDTKESLLRNGKKVANHTNIGWEEAIAMLAETSNQPSSSEVPLTTISAAPLIEVQ